MMLIVRARAAAAAFLILFFGVCAGSFAQTTEFSAQATAAPAGGAALSGLVRLEVTGVNLQNVELLPATGYTPRFGVFNISSNRTFAWLDLDTRILPAASSLYLRISAFNAPAGQPGASEIVAMPPRIWNMSRPPSPTGGFAALVDSAPTDNVIVQGTTRITVRGNRMVNVELLPASGYLPRLGVFNVAPDGASAWLDFDSRSLPDGVRGVRVSAFSTTPGQAGASEIVAMPARRWDFRNGMTSAFTVASTTAPLHGEIISGIVRFEVHGSGIQNAELLPPTGYLPRIASFNVSRDGTYAWLDLHTSALPAGALNARVSVFNAPAGQASAQEIIAVPAREWTIVR